MLTSISVIVPVYNEATRIKFAVDQVMSALNSLDGKVQIEIIYVDDGSSDGSSDVIERIILDYPLVPQKLIKHQGNRGVGAAFISGVLLANYEFITVVAGDGIATQFGLKELWDNAKYGLITLSNRKNRYLNHCSRRLLSKLLGIWFSWLTKTQVVDPHGSFLVPTKIAKDVIKKIWGNNNSADLDGTYHIIFLQEALRHTLIYKTVNFSINQELESNSTVWNLYSLKKFTFTCFRITLNKVNQSF
jgi:glycosyltransferase involved in cell wall biosynthesis